MKHKDNLKFQKNNYLLPVHSRVGKATEAYHIDLKMKTPENEVSTVFRPQLIMDPQLRKEYEGGRLKKRGFNEAEVTKARNLFLDSNQGP